MQSWFHFLPICLLLVLSGPATAIPTEPLVLGIEDNWYPYTAYRDDRIQGMSASIVRVVFRTADTPVQLDSYPYSRCMKLALKGLVAGCFNISPNPHILADYRLPRYPLFRTEIQLQARRDEAQPVNTEQAPNGRKVVVTLDYEYGDDFDRRHGPVHIPVCEDYYDFLMPQYGRVDYAPVCRNTARQLSSEHPELEGQFQPVATVHCPELYLSSSRHHPQTKHLFERFDLGMQRILANDEYRKILDGWSQAADATPQSDYTHRHSTPQGADMTLTPELIDELELLVFSNLNDTQEGLKAHHTADGKAVAATRRLHDKGPTDQPDGGYLTSLGLDTVEQARDLLTILKGWRKRSSRPAPNRPQRSPGSRCGAQAATLPGDTVV